MTEIINKNGYVAPVVTPCKLEPNTLLAASSEVSPFVTVPNYQEGTTI